MFSKQDIHKFKDIVLNDYGVTLTDNQALDQATATITAFESVIKDIIDNRYEIVKNDK